jgi:arylsulfatase A-like enzyme
LGNSGSRAEAMRQGPWKLVVSHPNAPPGSFENEHVELYRLDQDPSEKANLAESEPKQAMVMLTRLKAWLMDTRRTATPQPGGWLNQQGK